MEDWKGKRVCERESIFCSYKLKIRLFSGNFPRQSLLERYASDSSLRPTSSELTGKDEVESRISFISLPSSQSLSSMKADMRPVSPSDQLIGSFC